MVDDLGSQASDFAQCLENLLTAVLGESPEPYTRSPYGRSRKGLDSMLVEQSDRAGVPLRVDGRVVLRLEYSYRCTCDNPAHELQIDESSVMLRVENDPTPLMHYDYVRNVRGSIPAAHINIHASNDEATKAMLACGGKAQGRNRRKDFVERGVFPTFSVLHFPVGGDRMRPGIEDVLQMARYEFGIDMESGWLDAIEQSREEYRTTQLRAFVREFPDIAFEELRNGGYVEGSTPSRPGRPDRISRMRRY